MSSEIQKRAINLGKELVKELELEPGVDTLSKWMAHYISEQIAIAENSTGEEKEKAKQKCFNTILKLWERRDRLPNGSRPFEDFEQIFQVLKKIDLKNDPKPFHELKDFDKIKEEELDSEVEYWIDKVELINNTTRKLIRVCLAQAYASTKDDKIKRFLNNSIDSAQRYDIKSIELLKSFYEELESQEYDFDDEDENRTIKEELDKFLEGIQEIRDKI